MLKTYHFSSPHTGAHTGRKLLVLGGIHGNEKCGSMAIANIIAEFEAALFTLDHGSVTFVPICNPKAYLHHKRYIDHNLNRLIGAQNAPSGYESTLAPFIQKLIDTHDILLDLHSYANGTTPFLFLDQDDADHRAFARALNLPAWLLSWNESYRKAALSLGTLTPDATVCDTSGYAARMGKIELTIECGQHDDPNAPLLAKNAILSALHHFGLITHLPPYHTPVSQTPTLYRMTDIIIKKKLGRLARSYLHFDAVQKNETIALYDDGTKFIAPADGVIIMPDDTCALHQEWFYLGAPIID